MVNYSKRIELICNYPILKENFKYILKCLNTCSDEVIKMAGISLAAITHIIKIIDPSIRIGKETTNMLRNAAEEYAKRISEIAILMARNANRSTVLIQDIESAKEQFIKGITFVESHLPD